MKENEQQIVNSTVVDDAEIAGLEKALARHFAAPYCLTVGSGSQAILAALMACGVGSDTEVILGPIGWGQALAAVLMVGATPVVVDCDEYGGICPQAARAAITKKTRAILPVCPAGVADNLPELYDLCQQEDVLLINDASQASRLVATTSADLVCLSFGPSKLVTAGEGGAILSTNAELIDHAILLSQHPLRASRELLNSGRYESISEFFFSFRMSPLHVPYALTSLTAVESRLAARKRTANRIHSYYQSCLSEIGRIRISYPPACRVGDNGRVNMLIDPMSKRDSYACVREQLISHPDNPYPAEPEERTIACKANRTKDYDAPVFLRQAMSRVKVAGSLNNAQQYCRRLISVQTNCPQNETERRATQ